MGLLSIIQAPIRVVIDTRMGDLAENKNEPWAYIAYRLCW